MGTSVDIISSDIGTDEGSFDYCQGLLHTVCEMYDKNKLSGPNTDFKLVIQG